MNVLFVCVNNIGRSQMAAALCNKYAKAGHAASAGTMVGNDDGQTIAERATTSPGAQHVIDILKEEGVDISANRRTQVRETMLEEYDKIIVMAEKETIPGFLHGDNVVRWHIDDLEVKNLANTKALKEEIKAKVLQLVSEG